MVVFESYAVRLSFFTCRSIRKGPWIIYAVYLGYFNLLASA